MTSLKKKGLLAVAWETVEITKFVLTRFFPPSISCVYCYVFVCWQELGRFLPALVSGLTALSGEVEEQVGGDKYMLISVRYEMICVCSIIMIGLLWCFVVWV